MPVTSKRRMDVRSRSCPPSPDWTPQARCPRCLDLRILGTLRTDASGEQPQLGIINGTSAAGGRRSSLSTVIEARLQCPGLDSPARRTCHRCTGLRRRADIGYPFHFPSTARGGYPSLGGQRPVPYDSDTFDDLDRVREHTDGAILGPDTRAIDYSRIREWLNYCHEGHPSCQETRSSALRPIRLFDVHFRCLVRYRPRMRYIALSYVWGDIAQEHVLASGRIPRTIEDSVTVAKALGLRYLWVDSICIDQSDENDKRVQIGIMDQIYEGAFLTIVALHGDNAESGLPGVSSQEPRQSPLVLNSGVLRVFDCVPSLSEEIAISNWSQRAWTFQEGLLSRRRLIFTPHQVYFVCSEGIASELSVRLYAMREDDINRPLEFNNLLLQPSWLSPGYERGIITLENVINRYIDKKISHDTDSLNSVSALLQRISLDFLPRGMAYGLPLGDFRTSLVWYQHRKSGEDDEDRSGTLNSTRQRNTPSIPSWSWAAWEFFQTTINFDTYFRYHLMPPLTVSNAALNIHISPDLLTAGEHNREADRYNTVPVLECSRFYKRLISQGIVDLTLDGDTSILSDLHLNVTGILLNLPCRVALKSQETAETPLYIRHLGLPEDMIYDVLVRWCNEVSVQDIVPIDREIAISSPQQGSTPREQRHDLLLVTAKSSSTWHLMKFYCLDLCWKDGIATRGGVVIITVENKDAPRFWEWCAPGARFCRFWLG